jgi:hypothetical protein
VVFGKLRRKGSGKEAISPAISSVIMTGAMVAIVGVALVFANNILWSRVAEGEFDSSRQFMQSVGLQIDDVAWTVGRTETISYASQYGEVVLEPDVLTYTVSIVADGVPYEFSNTTGALMFNLPTSRYSITNNYWERIFPAEDNHLPLNGTSAPVARVFVVEDLSMSDGNYIRVVVVPAIRVLYSSINSSTNTYYIRMYLPVLSAGESPRLSQSITLTGESLYAQTINAVESVSVAVDFPSEGSGFTSNFFHFPDGDVPDDDNSEALDIPPIVIPHEDDEYDDVVLEFYLSEVEVGFGLNY